MRIYRMLYSMNGTLRRRRYRGEAGYLAALAAVQRAGGVPQVAGLKKMRAKRDARVTW